MFVWYLLPAKSCLAASVNPLIAYLEALYTVPDVYAMMHRRRLWWCNIMITIMMYVIIAMLCYVNDDDSDYDDDRDKDDDIYK